MARSIAGLLLFLAGTTCMAQDWPALVRDCIGLQVSSDQAIEACNAALANPKLPARARAALLGSRGAKWRDKGDLDRAVADYSEAIRTDPQFATSYSGRASTLLRRKDYEGAIADYDEAMRLEPGSYRGRYLHHFFRGRAKSGKGDHDGAIEDFDEAGRINPKFQTMALAFRGRAWMDKGELDRALEDLDEAIRLSPASGIAHHHRGLAWAKKGDHDKAIADYTEAIRLDARTADFYQSRGDAWRAKGDEERAAADYKEAARLAPASGNQ
jgi:tetratricopeptide (TPR) repeat protein